MTLKRHVSGFLLLCAGFTSLAQAGNLRIPLPGTGKATPVQRLNREGVEAVRKHRYEKASSLFYKAYLYDPSDPFTLNNLGYMAELNGDVDRAVKFYDLAAHQPTDAVIDQSSSQKLKGSSFRDGVSGIDDRSIAVSRANLHAVQLLSKGRNSEADGMLQSALAQDPQNPFTLNNLGVAKEAEAEWEAAVKYYSAAAAIHSSRPVVVTDNRASVGKPVSEVAADSARRLRERLARETAHDRAARLNFRGVEALNRNDWEEANRDFRAAYSLDPGSAFSLNNLGYIAEQSGDSETAKFFYERAAEARDAGAVVGLASGRYAEGMKLAQVSDQNNEKIAAQMAAEVEARRRQGGPVKLKHRDNTPVADPVQSSPAASDAQGPPAPAPVPSEGAQTPNQ